MHFQPSITWNFHINFLSSCRVSCPWFYTYFALSSLNSDLFESILYLAVILVFIVVDIDGQGIPAIDQRERVTIRSNAVMGMLWLVFVSAVIWPNIWYWINNMFIKDPRQHRNLIELLQRPSKYEKVREWFYYNPSHRRKNRFLNDIFRND